MYNFDLATRRAKDEERRKDDEKRRKQAAPENRERIMKLTYNKSFSEMVSSSNTRRAALASSILRSKQESLHLAQRETERLEELYMYIPNKTRGEVPIHRHLFRDRRQDREVGPQNGHISPKTYVPRAYYHGGGKMDLAKTMAIRSLASPVDMLDPRPATASIVDGGKIRGRLKRNMYTGPIENGGLRMREKSKEIQPPIRFKAQTEAERVNDSISQNSVSPPGPYQKSLGSDIIWRPITPEKWVGPMFKRVSTPADIVRNQLNGSPVEKGFGSSGEPYSWGEEEGMRGRDKSRELHGDFESVVPSDEYLRSEQEYKNLNVWENEDYPKAHETTFNNSLKETRWAGVDFTASAPSPGLTSDEGGRDQIWGDEGD